jgi:YndJ-like protein
MSGGARAFAGAVVFTGSTLWGVPALNHAAWAHALLLLAALVLAPLLLDLIRARADDAETARWLRFAVRLQFPAALLLVPAMAREAGAVAALCALPWACVLASLAFAGAWRLGRRGWRPLPELLRDAGLVYAVVGAGWLMAERWGVRPLGFSGDIVMLTAVHFHYAGWLLPVLTGLALGRLPASRGAALTGFGVLVGVPAVAIGITASQLGAGPVTELVAAVLLALSGCGVAGLHLQLVWTRRWPGRVRWLWGVAAISLTAGMVFAAVYGVRSFFQPWSWLDLPWMRALHGTLNAIGFGFAGTLGWWLADGADGKGIEPRPGIVTFPR